MFNRRSTHSYWLFALVAACASPTIDDEPFTGTAALNDSCSGAIVRFAQSTPDDVALLLTSGHCLELIPTGVVIRARPDDQSVQLFDRRGDMNGSIRTTEVLYATMTGTDLALVALDRSYSMLEADLDVRAMTLAASSPALDTEIVQTSGLHTRERFCTVEAIVDTVRESDWEWRSVLRYACPAQGGTSGSPVRDIATGEVVGVTGTTNTGGADGCNRQSPCEVAADGTTEGLMGAVYGHQVHMLYSCLDADGTFDPDVAGCPLP